MTRAGELTQPGRVVVRSARVMQFMQLNWSAGNGVVAMGAAGGGDTMGDERAQSGTTLRAGSGTLTAEAAGRLVEARLMQLVEARITEAGTPLSLAAAMRHVLLAPGKRVRPILLLLALDRLGEDPAQGVDAACSLEMLHAASLVIDDLPAMDDADRRRGRPATHIAYGEDRAILAAFSLIAEAVRVVSEAPALPAEGRAWLAALVARALGPDGLTAGQELDLHALAHATSVAEIEAVHLRKTGVLFAAALEAAAVIAGAGDASRAHHREAGLLLGLGFQALDDLHDVAGDPATLGKPVGQDAGKVTLASLLGREAAFTHAEDRIAEARRLIGLSPRCDSALGCFIAGLTGSLSSRIVLAGGRRSAAGVT
ncbi:MAG: polyprenyl synthetase family protein [Hyphomicrobiaceae bacterium]|nr:polyprenyl synthetase family protein [Hyphomicrobiaceae bacterium]